MPKAPPPVLPKRLTVLEQAALVAGSGAPRAKDYDPPRINHIRIARLWEAMLDLPQGFIGARKAALMMGAVKLAREAAVAKEDNYVDLAGYALCASEIAEEEKSGPPEDEVVCERLVVRLNEVRQ